MSRPKTCVRTKENNCKGRITLEHAFTYAGRQIDESWAIVHLCAYHHAVDEFMDSGDLIKGVGQLAGLRLATDEDLRKYPRVDWSQIKRYLEKTYGHLL